MKKKYTLLIVFYLFGVTKADDKIVQEPSPSINYLFHAGFHSSIEFLNNISTKQELDKHLLDIRQSYLICYAYWYASNIEKVKILDEDIEALLSVILTQLDNHKFDMRKDLSLLRSKKNQTPLSEIELDSLHRATGFPCSRLNFISDEKYEDLANQFVAWSKTLTVNKGKP